jgi:hypothetical protein
MKAAKKERKSGYTIKVLLRLGFKKVFTSFEHPNQEKLMITFEDFALLMW